MYVNLYKMPMINRLILVGFHINEILLLLWPNDLRPGLLQHLVVLHIPGSLAVVHSGQTSCGPTLEEVAVQLETDCLIVEII